MLNKLAIVTGATGSIGKEIAKCLVESNYKVILVGRSDSKLTQVKNEIASLTGQHDLVITHKIDISEPLSVDQGVAYIDEYYGPIDVLINAAGNGEPTDFFSTTEDDWQVTMQAKLLGTIRMTQAVTRTMSKYKSGKVIIINGTFCYDPDPLFIINSTVNAALAGFTKACSKYLATKNINLNVINPWITETESWSETCEKLAEFKGIDKEVLDKNLRSINPSNRYACTEDINNAILFLLSEKSSFINGASLNIDGGATVGF
ncbi:3-ketoacyl-ACP reductase [Yersinia intermedia]|uniref:3-ketoacyl-ACP reductase n=1 Tax=Yersinia intermedia TaxID=631 RepID=A0A0H5MGT5_YERIN|nr:SDR family NAD(P)-dependent oxidoreductase [Yersinia intermedia]CRY56281.1 3-ketoacyl-ACP reductase [Yersinia intermedia]